MSTNTSNELLDAVRAGNLGQVQVVMFGGPDLEVRDRHGNTPLMLACRDSENRFQIAVYLIERGANVNAVNHAGESALHLLADHGDTRVIDALLRQHANPTLRDVDDKTPLHRFMEKGFAPGAAALVDDFYQPALLLNSQDRDGNTPMHHADKIPMPLALQMLGYGADPTIRNNEGKTPAQSTANPLLAQAFRAHAAMLAAERMIRRQAASATVDATIPGVSAAVQDLMAAPAAQLARDANAQAHTETAPRSDARPRGPR